MQTLCSTPCETWSRTLSQRDTVRRVLMFEFGAAESGHVAEVSDVAAVTEELPRARVSRPSTDVNHFASDGRLHCCEL